VGNNGALAQKAQKKKKMKEKRTWPMWPYAMTANSSFFRPQPHSGENFADR
jgi:hypothetical protein